MVSDLGRNAEIFYLQWCLIYTPSHKSVQNIHRTKYMPLRAEIEQQETLERNQIKGGLEKLRKDTLHLEKKNTHPLLFMVLLPLLHCCQHLLNI